MPSYPTLKARRFLAKRAACAATLTPAGRRLFLATTLTLVRAARSKGSFAPPDKAFLISQIEALLTEARKVA